MAFRLDDFKALVSKGGGLAKPNLFNIYLPSLGGNTRDLNLLCKAAALPGRQITSTDYQIGTPLIKVANGYAVTDITLTFYVLNDFAVKEYFDTWQKLAHDGYEIGYYNDYVKPVVVQQLTRVPSIPLLKKKLFNTEDVPSFILNRLPTIGPFDLSQGEFDLNLTLGSEPVYTVLLHEAYPTTVGELQLVSEQDGIHELQVQLSYKNWSSGKSKADDNLLASVTGYAIDKIKKLLF